MLFARSVILLFIMTSVKETESILLASMRLSNICVMFPVCRYMSFSQAVWGAFSFVAVLSNELHNKRARAVWEARQKPSIGTNPPIWQRDFLAFNVSTETVFSLCFSCLRLQSRRLPGITLHKLAFYNVHWALQSLSWSLTFVKTNWT